MARYHIEARTKWLPFCRWHFQINFVWKLFSFYSNFTEVCPKGLIHNKPAIVQIIKNRLALNRWQAIITWMNDETYYYWHICLTLPQWVITWYWIYQYNDIYEIDQTLNQKKTPHSSPSRASYGVSGEYFEENWPCYYRTALYFTELSLLL